MKSFATCLIFLISSYLTYGQNLLPTPFSYAPCNTFASPTSWTNCTGSPDCAASRCTVPGGCSGQGVMCFGESFFYMLPSPLTVGQGYTISMNVCVGILGGQAIVGGNHSFVIIGLTAAPSNCGAANYGSACATPGATTLLSGTMNTVGWQSFTNTFTALSAIRYIVIGNCDNSGNGGNLFCNAQLAPTVILPVEIAAFNVEPNGCQVDAFWSVADGDNALDHFELRKSTEGRDEIVAKIPASRNTRDFQFTDGEPAINGDYQLQLVYRDGTESQSEVLHVKSNCEGQSAGIEGNPVHGALATLRFESNGLPVPVTMHNIEGRLVRSILIPATDAGWHRHDLDVNDLQPGLYFVRVDGKMVKMELMR